MRRGMSAPENWPRLFGVLLGAAFGQQGASTNLRAALVCQHNPALNFRSTATQRLIYGKEFERRAVLDIHQAGVERGFPLQRCRGIQVEAKPANEGAGKFPKGILNGGEQ